MRKESKGKRKRNKVDKRATDTQRDYNNQSRAPQVPSVP